MTFLLRGEVEAHSLRSKYDQLEIKVDTLTKLLLPNNINNTNNNNNTNNIHNNLNGMGGPGFGFGVGMGAGTGEYINPNYSSISNYTPPLAVAVTGNGNGTGQQGQGQGGGYEFYPHSVSDLNSTYMSAYMSYIQADTPISGIKDLESQKKQRSGSDMKDMNGMAKSHFNSNLSENSSQHRTNQTLNNNQSMSQKVPYTPLPLPLPPSTPFYRTISATTTNINNNDGHTHNNTLHNTNTNTNKNKSAQNGEFNHGSISGTSTSDWLFACTPHKTPITSNTTNGGQIPGANAPHSNASQISMLESTCTPIVKSEYKKVNSMIMGNGFTKESLGTVRYEYDSPSMISTTENVPQSSDRSSMSLQRRLFSQPSHFSLPDGNETLNSSHPQPLLHPSSHPPSHPSSHTSSHLSSHPPTNPSTTAHTQSHILPYSHTTIQNTAQSLPSTLTRNSVSVYDSNSQINGNVSVTPYNDIRGIITKNLAQSFLDVDASLTQIENSTNGYSTYTSSKGDEYNISEKENCEIHRNIPDNITFFEGTRSQLPNNHYVSSHRVPQSPVSNITPVDRDTVDRYTASAPLSGQRGSTGGCPLDVPPPPPTSASNKHKIDGYAPSGKPNMHMSGDSNVKRDVTVHVPQGFNPPGPNPHSHYNSSPRKPSIPSFDVLNTPSSSSSYSCSSTCHHSHIQSPSHSPSPTLANRPSSQPILQQRSSSSISSTHRNTAASSDNEQGSMCVPSSNVPLPSAPPNHPFSLKNIENPLFHSLNSGTNKPVYDARHGSFSRK